MCAPGIDGLAVDLNITSQTVSTLAITLYVLGLAIGPMFMSPLSEVYGRLPVYHSGNLVFVGFMVGSALSKNIGQFMVFRFISGCAGGTPMALGGGTIADVTTIEQRGLAMALFSLGPLTGPVSRNSDLVPGPQTVTHPYPGSRPRHRGLRRSQQRLALDLLAAGHSRRRRWNRRPRHHA